MLFLLRHCIPGVRDRWSRACTADTKFLRRQTERRPHPDLQNESNL